MTDGSKEYDDDARRERLVIPAAARLLTDPQFQDHMGRMSSLLARSLEHRSDPPLMLEVQAELISLLLGAQSEQKRLDGLRNGPAADSDSKELETLSSVCKLLQRTIRQIADGIAWRSLAYDRAMIHALSIKNATGHVERDSALSEVTAAAAHLDETGDLVVINDLTNFLRYGDYTAIGEEGVSIIEVKAGEGSAQSGKATRQKQRTRRVIDFLRNGYEEDEDGEIRTILSWKTRPVAHFDELRELLKRVRGSGFANARISDCLAVTAVDVTMMSAAVAPGNFAKYLKNPFEQSSQSESFDTLRMSARFTRNIAPYSIFPLPIEDRFDILTGRTVIFTHYNYGNLVRCMRRRDLTVELPTRVGLARLAELRPGEVAAHELDHPWRVSLRNGNRILSIPLSGLTRVVYEFLDEDSFLDTVEEELELLDTAPPMYIHAAFKAEAELWD